MNALVHIKGNDIFTDSLIIAKGTQNTHKSIKQTIKDYELQLRTLGNLSFLKRQINENETRGRKAEVVELNEPQASFLITRQLILKRSTAEWQETRQNSKAIRLQETDEIKRYVEYCEQHGSKNAKRYYTTLSNLVNNALGLTTGQRDEAAYETLQLVSLLENTIRFTIMEEVQKATEYHRIYQICKEKVAGVMSYIYLPEQRLLTG